MGQKLGEEVARAEVAAPRFTAKKGGIIPPKRKSVKKIIGIEIAQSVSSLLRLCCLSSNSPEDPSINTNSNSCPKMEKQN